MTDYKDLIERLEKAEPDREIDVAICVAIGKTRLDPGFQTAPNYTGSLDAALTLVPNEYDFELVLSGTAADRNVWTAAHVWWETERSQCEGGWKVQQGNSRTPAIALCIAALKARQAMS